MVVHRRCFLCFGGEGGLSRAAAEPGMAGPVQGGDDFLELGNRLVCDLTAIPRRLLVGEMEDDALQAAEPCGGRLLDLHLAVHLEVSHRIDGQ